VFLVSKKEPPRLVPPVALGQLIQPEPGRELTARIDVPLRDGPGEVAIVWYFDEEFESFGDGLFVPRRFWGDWFGLPQPDVRVVLEIALEHGRLACKMAHVRCGDLGEVDTSTMRALNLSGLVDATAAAASFVRTESGQYEIWAKQDEDDVSAWKQKVSRTPRRGKAISDEELKRVAEIYRAALLRREPPTKAVALEMPCARSTAGKWVVMARERGFLNSAPPRGHGGEVKSTKTKRGTDKGRKDG